MWSFLISIVIFNICKQCKKLLTSVGLAQARPKYQQRVHQVENALFTPLLFTITGGMGDAATQRLANLFEC